MPSGELTSIVHIGRRCCSDCMLVVSLDSRNSAFHKNFIAFFGCELERANGAHEVRGLVTCCVHRLGFSVHDLTSS